MHRTNDAPSHRRPVGPTLALVCLCLLLAGRGPERALGQAPALVPAGAEWRYHKGLTAHLAGWTGPGFDDGSWPVGAAPFRYGDGSGGTVLDDMPGAYSTVALRAPFTLADPASVTGLALMADYDDGFVAWINGAEVVRANAPAAAYPSHTAVAPEDHESGVPERFDIPLSDPASFLRSGENTLAILVLNVRLDSSDLMAGFSLTDERPVPAVADTKFSHDRGFYETAFEVTVTSETPGAEIWYRLDGGPPAPGLGTRYSEPLTITTTTILRAMAHREGYEPTDIDTQTYLFLEDVLRQPADVAGFARRAASTGRNETTVMDFAMDPRIVDDSAYRAELREAMRAIPSMAISMDVEALFGDGGVYYSGNGSRSGPEHPAAIEWIDPADPGGGWSAHAGVRPHSHPILKRSLRLLFRRAHGDAKLKAEPFAGSPLEADSATDSFDRLILRAGTNRSFVNAWNPDDSTYTRDEWARASQIAMSGMGVHGTYVHLYLDGLYSGLYNLVERPDHFFSASYFGGEPEDWYAVNHGGAVEGDGAPWSYLIGALKDKDMREALNYGELGRRLDLEQFADYLLLNWYAGTADWPGNNWYATLRTSPEIGPARFFVWDAEDIWDDEGSSGPFDRPGGRGSDGAWVPSDFRADRHKGQGPTIARLFHAARESDEFLMLLADRAHAHLSDGGALSTEASQARWRRVNEHLRGPIIGESARWGDSRAEKPGEEGLVRTRDGTWAPEVARVYDASMPGNPERLIAALRAQGYYPAIDPPRLSQGAGRVPPGFALSMLNPNATGDIWVGLNGRDPRAAGGGLSAAASMYDGPIPITSTRRVRARVRVGATWSALAEATYLRGSPSLRISELHYHPAEDADLEFLEIVNAGAEPAELSGVRLVEGLRFDFGHGAEKRLEPGEHRVAVRNMAAFRARYGDLAGVAGQYEGRLDNAGETVRLVDSLGGTLHAFSFDDAWHPETDGGGSSLVAADLAAAAALWSTADGWRPSTAKGGSPGAADPATAGSGLDPTPPGAPSGVSARVVGESAIDVSWRPVDAPPAGLRAYRLYRDGRLVVETAVSNHVDRRLRAGMTHRYSVTAVSGHGVEGPASAEVSIGILAIESASIVDATSIELRFSEPLLGASAEALDHYSLLGTDLLDARLERGGRILALTTGELELGREYRLGLRDLVGLDGAELPPDTWLVLRRGTRVTEGLLARYELGGGVGGIVRAAPGAALAPLDLHIEAVDRVRWLSHGLQLVLPTLVASAAPAADLSAAIRDARELSVEAWLMPSASDQEGPARIVTLSSNTSLRNLTLGQDGDRYVVRLRTTSTGVNGASPAMLSSPGSLRIDRPAHVVYTRDAAGEARIYIDGALNAEASIPGDLSTWDEGYRLAFGNELSGDRPWLGTLSLVAFYGRPLSAEEVEQNHLAGSAGAPPPRGVPPGRLYLPALRR